MKKIEVAVNRIAHQVENVLNFVQKTPLTLRKTNTLDIIDECVGAIILPTYVKLIIPKNNIKLICDSEKLSIALYNLVMNSIQSIDGVGTIEITCTEKNDKNIIEIIDSGPGIPEEELDKIFEPLFTTKQAGTGLGLISCKTIIEHHGGTISVKNNPTTFTITIPKHFLKKD